MVRPVLCWNAIPVDLGRRPAAPPPRRIRRVLTLVRGRARPSGHFPVCRVGARTSPFGAHAWVEAEGRPAGEDDNITGFRVLMTVGPRVR
ncbi:lasso peptide biosynthesis B2 protein [Actinomadura terrae]|uniref:lasso peptide biosynthesis B2 protein n=1 Tax=Actinomadura terrae TaxID=604353 RepID=UPI001FA7BF00|nr:lasso peptide biosynthesis B2 protein [Actinomadura terrae]